MPSLEASTWKGLLFDVTCGKLQCLKDLVDERSSREWGAILHRLTGLRTRLDTAEGSAACAKELVSLRAVLKQETYGERTLDHFNNAIDELQSALSKKHVRPAE